MKKILFKLQSKNIFPREVFGKLLENLFDMGFETLFNLYEVLDELQKYVLTSMYYVDRILNILC